MENPFQPILELLKAIRSGDAKVQSEILKRYEPWLRLLAKVHMETRLQARFDASDVVRQALLEAYRKLPSFRGQNEGEILAWLRTILSHVLHGEIERWEAEKRGVPREAPMPPEVEETSRAVSRLAPAGTPPTGPTVLHTESEVIFASALERLSPEHREVIILHNMEGLPHEEVARRMGQSPGAVRLLWVRALGQLRRALAENRGPSSEGPAAR